MIGQPAPPARQSRQDFIGRVDEIARLRAALDAARSGRGGLVLVAGPPGIGKSRLIAEFADLAAAAGVRVLVGRSWEAGGAPPYWPWVQALRSHLRTVDRDLVLRQMGMGVIEMATLLPEIEEVGPRASDMTVADSASDRFRLFDAATTFLRSIAETEPLVVVLEDLQAADVPSLLLLQFVAHQMSVSRILVIATYRDVELTPDHPLSPILAELRRAPVTSSLAVPGLGVEDVTRFVEAASGAPTRLSVALALHRQTGGNPLFLEEAFRLLANDPGGMGTSGMTRLTVPAEIRAVIDRRLEGLSIPTRDSLQIGSVFGNEFDLESISRILGTTVEEVLDRLSEAVAAGLIVEVAGTPGRFRFGHDLIRHSLYAGLTPARRVRFHRQAAEILEEVYGDKIDDHLAELALHHFEAAPGADVDRAIEFGRRAGDEAMRVLAYEEAVRLYEMAIDVSEAMERSEPITLDLLLSLGDARVRAGDLPGAEEAFSRAADIARRLGDVRKLARAAVGYGGRFIVARAGADSRMIPLLQDALVLLGGEDDQLRVRLLSRLACALRSGPREHSDALSRQAVALARQLGDPHTLIYALAGRAGAIWWPENPEERLEIGDELVSIAEAAGAIERLVDGHMTRCAALLELGDVRAARRELKFLSRTGGPLRLPVQHWLEDAMRAWFALFEGRLGEVEPWIEGMLARAPTTPARDNVSGARSHLFLLRREQGRLGEIEDTIRDAADDFPWYPIHRLAHAYVLMEIGRVAESRMILQELSADRFSALHTDNYRIVSLCLAAEVAVGLGDAATGGVIYELLAPFSSRNAVGFPEGSLGAVARYLGLLAALAGDLDAAEEHSSFAESFNRRMGARPWLAHTLYDRARLLGERGEPGDDLRADALLAECMDLCAEMGMSALQRQVEARMASRPEPAPGPVRSARFRREGEYYSIEFAGLGFRVKDSKGMRYLAVLLGSPGREIHALDLVSAADGVDPQPRGRVGSDADFIPGDSDSGPILDRRARHAYEQRLAELEEDIGEAEAFGDSARASAARQEQQFLAAELATAIGLGGRDRKAVSAAERARVNVTRSVRSALKRVSEHSPALGDHLDATIQTGTFCSYLPDPRIPISWEM